MFGMKKQLYLFSNFMPLLENVILSPLPRRLGYIRMLKSDGRVSTSVQLQKYLYLCIVKKHLLFEVSIIRPLVIFLLVVYHSLCIYTGGWPVPQGLESNDFYWWLGHLISGFRIETIALVGGYVFSYQCNELARRTAFFPFVWKKFKRLIIPCFVFGAIYYFLFLFHASSFKWNVFFWRLANGVSHLWFLPMLFWCFLVGWLTDRLLHLLSLRKPSWCTPVSCILLLLFAALSLLRVTGLRMGLSRAPYFHFYFYLGYILRYHSMQRPQFHLSRGHIALLWTLYIVFLLLHLQATHLRLPGCSFLCPKWLQGCSQIALRLFTLGHTTCGILALYATVRHWLGLHRTPDAEPGVVLREASRLCYGVYVFHMFFLQWLLYYTSFPQWCSASLLGVWMLPWALLFVSLLFSTLCTSLLLKTSWGRFLIG